ncbi:MAG: glutaminyl-peptide cyclotransferase [Flavobacteriaceae bacterium]|nr:glutaminyl-peptide cyclotransferase [Flavobacteriaceae bacterium]
MKKMQFSILPLLFLASLTCNDNTKNRLKIDVHKAGRLTWGDSLKVTIKTSNISLDSIKFQLNGEPIDPPQVLNNQPLGEQTLKATGYIDGKSYFADKKLNLYSDVSPQLYEYELRHTYPHDPTAYTQGLEFYGDTLYESTGLRGQSSLRKVDYLSGEVLKIVSLDDSYFGEGLTILNGEIIQLTWTSKIGFVYDLETMELKHSFDYGESQEGWGLCNDGSTLFKSDGTPRIWSLDSQSFEEMANIQATTHRNTIQKLNELEYHNGYIYANTYQLERDVVVIIDPKNGQVVGLINFQGLKDLVDPSANPDVLNGIAYHHERGTFFVTGKNWDKLFEVSINPRKSFD